MKRKRSPSPEVVMRKRQDTSGNQNASNPRRQTQPNSMNSSLQNDPISSMDTQRHLSKLSYLQKSSKKQRVLLSKQLEVESRLIPEEKLTELERKQRMLREKALHMKIDGVDTNELQRLKDRDNMLLNTDDGFSLKEDHYIGRDKKLELLEQTKKHAYVGSGENDFKSWERNQEIKSGVKPELLQEVPYIFEEIQFISQQRNQAKKLEESKIAKDETPKTMKEIRESLPVFKYREQIIEAVKMHSILIVVGETGSGKTTQIPQYMYEAGICDSSTKMMACTQPRRVAAMSVATRVAEEMNVELGMEVGYSIRFEDLTSDKTVIKYMTDGMMLRELMIHPDMKDYSAIMIDEAHERSLNSDILFALVKDIAAFRPDFRVIIASATLEAKRMSDYFNAPILYIPGRTFAVETFYTAAPESDYLEASIIATLQIHMTQPPGDILVFLTGQDEIEAAAEELERRTQLMGNQLSKLLVRPIYSSMPAHEQSKIFEPTPEKCRKVVLATNIAETSITIDGIVYVVDTGFCKQNSYDPRTKMESLVVTPISRANADQRKGRAGRVRPGKCFRLYTKHSYQQDLPEAPVPEIQRSNLSNVILLLKSLGINNLLDFDFMDPPPIETIATAIQQLYALGAIGDNGALTKLGRRMSEFPLDPSLSRTLLAAERYGCTNEVAIICAMLSSSQSLFYTVKGNEEMCENARKSFLQPAGDHLTLLHVYNEWEESDFSSQWCRQHFIQPRVLKTARNVYIQLTKLMQKLDIKVESCEGLSEEAVKNICKSFCAGFFYHAAQLQKGGAYRTYHNPQIVHVHPSSALIDRKVPWVIYHELLFTTKEFMRQIIEIQPDWLVEIAPHVFTIPKDLGIK